MGELGNIPERMKHYIGTAEMQDILNDCLKLMEENELSLDQAIQINKIAEYQRRTNCIVDNYDRTDENLEGFGNLIERFIEETNNIGASLHNFCKDDGAFQMPLHFIHETLKEKL